MEAQLANGGLHRMVLRVLTLCVLKLSNTLSPFVLPPATPMPPRILTGLVESADDNNHDHELDIAVVVERYMLKTALDARVGDPRTVDETYLFDEPFVALAPTQNTSTSCRHA